MIKMMKRRHHISALLLSACFFIYAVSPLSAIYQQKQVIGQTPSALNGIRLFVVELLLSPLTQDGDDTNGTSSRVLLRKKRAILSSDKLKSPQKHTKDVVIVSAGLILSDTPHISKIVDYCKPAFKEGLHHSYSGLSPPLV